MLIKTGDLRPGMVTEKGTIQEVILNCWNGGHLVVYTNGYRSLPLAIEHVDVTAVLGRDIKGGMDIKDFGRVLKTSQGGANFSFYSLGGNMYRAFKNNALYEIEPTSPPMDPEKHLLWAVQHKDWAQARATLTELEKQA